MNPVAPKSLRENRLGLLVCLLLGLATVAVYWQVRRADFINCDDPYYTYGNPVVTSGLTVRGVFWAFSTSFQDFWHPLTWLSHMLDCELFDARPGPHHLVSVAFHLASTLLLFELLRRMTGGIGRSAMVAALFALHPLHVESVAWVSERKDVLSAFFFMLTLLAYARYTRAEPGPECRMPNTTPPGLDPQLSISASPTTFGRRDSSSIFHPLSSLYYFFSLLFFACGLMAKAMLVTLPFMLLLLDWWPLNRYRPSTPGSGPAILRWFLARDSKEGNKAPDKNFEPGFFGFGVRGSVLPLLLEKLPFFLLSAISCVITYRGMKSGHILLSAEKIPWSFRLANVPISYFRYLGKLVWPKDLAVIYPRPAHWELWQVAGAVALLIIIMLFVGSRRRSAPYLAVGWLGFLGMLVPVIGLVANGDQSIADRYTYLPSIWLFVAGIWAIADMSSGWRFRTAWLGGSALLTLLTCAVLAKGQVRVWQNSFVLWTHCLAVTHNNRAAEYNLGFILQKSGQPAAAIEHYRASLRLDPERPEVNLSMGLALVEAGQASEATNYFAKAVSIDPDDVLARENLGITLVELGDYDGGARHCAEALNLDPKAVKALTALGKALSTKGRADDALRCYLESIRLNPVDGRTHYYLGLEWLKRGKFDEAITSLREAVRLDGSLADARMQLGRAFSLRETGQTVAQYREMLLRSPDEVPVLNNLALILATYPEASLRNGPEAIALALHACELTSNKETACLITLGAAYAEAGQFEKAVETGQKASDLAASLGQMNLFELNQALLRGYKNHEPYRPTN